MLLLVASVLGIVSVVPLGGRLSRLAAVRMRVAWLPVVLLAVQVLIISVIPGAAHSVLAIVHVATYAGAAVVIVANRHVPGLLLVGAGALANGLTIAVNGGTLPARPEAVASAGLSSTGGDFINSAPQAHPHLAWLGDVFAWPAPLPLHNTFSVGDVLILLGIVVGAHLICRSRVLGAQQQAPA